ncbi:MAG: hypothetical protein EON55_26320 [Alphaproteobacteria bacterium]|nr:MAG: hypothetical protein EON55_26320 [Alphaproteobacteria bacterium]
MDDAIIAEERAYWTLEVQRRTTDVEAARARGDAPHLLAGAELRLREAAERLAAMARPAHSVG